MSNSAFASWNGHADKVNAQAEGSGLGDRTGDGVSGEEGRRPVRRSTVMLSSRRMADVSHAAQSLALLLEAIGRGEIRASSAEAMHLEGAVDGLRAVAAKHDRPL